MPKLVELHIDTSEEIAYILVLNTPVHWASHLPVQTESHAPLLLHLLQESPLRIHSSPESRPQQLSALDAFDIVATVSTEQIAAGTALYIVQFAQDCQPEQQLNGTAYQAVERAVLEASLAYFYYLVVGHGEQLVYTLLEIEY